ncbi:hypothetical protein KVR01_012307 [Diaporthe batatas]|uniref:uncharacterized protein n=1 Tax=Diaporthe batatas TaxID=748121 RepID=UPI001D0396DF|nr:uncharacterized protein KVR01_012307 [Diaporthe batatas]KAG8158035.1 hypothetical protein KVR01_012307 [Diaporthe batatas]
MLTERTLPPRYEIRTLTREHIAWANAIIMHSTAFASPVWSRLYPDNKTRLCYDLFRHSDYLVSHAVASGLSLGIFDTQYTFQHADSDAAGGKLHWDLDDTGSGAGEADLVRQMDFPLLSVALAFDAFNQIDAARLAPLVGVMPLLADRNRILSARDGRDPGAREATGPGQVALRNSTATKAGEEGKGFMGHLARQMMRRLAGMGFRGVQIQCLHDSVHRVWSRPPAPFRAEVVARFHCSEDGDGEVRRLFKGSVQEVTKVYVSLR